MSLEKYITFTSGDGYKMAKEKTNNKTNKCPICGNKAVVHKRIKVNQISLQTLAETILSELDRQKLLDSDAGYGKVNYPYTLTNIYQTLLLYFEPTD